MAKLSLNVVRRLEKSTRGVAQRTGAAIGMSGSQQHRIKAAASESNVESDAVVLKEIGRTLERE
jgi:hypothetical protein